MKDTLYKNDPHQRAIENDMNETRSRMGNTLDKLSNQTEPSDILDGIYQWGRRKMDGLDAQASGDSIKGAASEAGRIVKDNPLPVALGLAAIGTTFLVSQHDSSNSKVGEKVSQKSAELKERANELTTQVATKSSELKDQLSMKTEQLRDKAMSKTEEVRDGASNHADSVGSKFSNMSEQASDKISELGETVTNQFQTTKENNPMPLCAGVLVSGFLLGLLLPKSRREEKLYGDAADRAKRKLVSTSRTLADDAKTKFTEKRQSLLEQGKEAISEYGDQVES